MYKRPLIDELEKYYSGYNCDESRLLGLIDEKIRNVSKEPTCEKKSCIHEILCNESGVKLFENTPLFFEISSGRGRYAWGGLYSKTAGYLKEMHRKEWIDEYFASITSDRERGLFCGWLPVGYDHLCPGYDYILEVGFGGILREAENKLSAETDENKKAFYSSVIKSIKALIHLQHRFEKEAQRLANEAETETKKAHFLKIAHAAGHCPENPPRSFYEALCTIAFTRECIGSIEGIGISTWGQLDRLLYPYYKKDIESGTITSEKAAELIGDLLAYTEARYELQNLTWNETSTTIELGGCDSEGNLVCNELTYIILDEVMCLGTIGTKINCRISQGHPDEYLRKIAQVQLLPLPSLMMHNDDVIIPARVKQGQAVEDARLYVGGGCHEVVLANTEVCTRADSWINVPGLLVETLKKHPGAKSFDEFCSAFVDEVKAYHNRIAELKNRGEELWSSYDSMPLYSATISTSLEKGLDVTEGGAKYNTTMLSMVGTATAVDSLYSIKKLVFDEKRLSLGELADITAKNFEGEEKLRHYIVNKLPKYGTNNPELNRFSAEVLSLLSKVSGQKNGRGGKYMPAFYPHEMFNTLGEITGATPDGRLAHMPLSRGSSPSEFIKTDSPLDIINSLKDIDFTDYADSFITEVTLPRLENNEKSTKILISVIKGFLSAGGSSLQFNTIDKEMLLEAKNNPQDAKFRNLYVRVCGYSAQFVALDERIKDEIIGRAVR